MFRKQHVHTNQRYSSVALRTLMRYLLPGLLLIIAVLSVSCEAEREPEVAEAAEEEQAEPEPVSVEAVNVYRRLQAYELSGDPPQASTVARLEEGEVLTAFPEEDLVQPEGFGIRVQRVIRENGTELWANHAYQIEGARPGVIVREGFVYTGPRITQINEDLRIPRTQVVAVVEEQSTQDFYRIAWNDYRTGGQFGELRTGDYVERELVSFFPSDLTVVRILNAAETLEDPEARRVLLRNALEQSGSELLDIVRGELDEIEASSEQD